MKMTHFTKRVRPSAVSWKMDVVIISQKMEGNLAWAKEERKELQRLCWRIMVCQFRRNWRSPKIIALVIVSNVENLDKNLPDALGAKFWREPVLIAMTVIAVLMRMMMTKPCPCRRMNVENCDYHVKKGGWTMDYVIVWLVGPS